MLFRKLYIFIMIEVILCAVNGHKSKSSLVFVIDINISMRAVLNQLQNETDKIFDAVFNSNSSRIEDIILVTFDEINAEIKCVTKDRDEFKRVLHDTKLVNGSDCLENTISGIKEALKICKPNSFIYVFTDLSAADYNQTQLVKSLSQKKLTQVNLVLLGLCNKYGGKYFITYKDLVKATSGQVFLIKRHEVIKVINYIIQTLKDKWTILKRKSSKISEKNIQFTVDSKINDIMISVSTTSFPNYQVTDSDGKVIEKTEILHTDNSAVDKIKVNPGVYYIDINNNNSSYLLDVSGATSVYFQYGFSLIEPTTLSETTTKPLDGFAEYQYLSIKLDNNESDVLLENVELRANGNILDNLSVKLINKEQQFYVTEPLIPPHGMFKIAINGYTNNKEKITRVSTITTEYQKLNLEPLPQFTPPTVTILSRSKVNIEFDGPLSLKCKVHAYPKPNVTWSDDSNSILSPKPMVPVDLPYDYISVLEMEHVNRNMTVTCLAEVGSYVVKKSVHIKTKNKFYLKILEYPKNTTVGYTKSQDFKCLVDASPSAVVSWFKDSKKISNDENFIISHENSTLTIKRMNPKVKGYYYVNVSNNQETKILPFKVSMSGTETADYRSPLVTILLESPINIEFGGSLTLKCKVRAYPKPNITWTDNSDAILSSKPATTLDFPYDYISVIEVNEINKNMTFTCTAVNVEGDKDTKSIKVTTKRGYIKILDYPKDKAVEYQKSGEFKCIVDAFPPATITWLKKYDIISNDDNYLISPDSSLLTIKSMKYELKGIYCANVSYSHEYTIFPFNVTMSSSEVPRIDKSNSIYNIQIGHSVNMSCRVTHGKPEPVLLWSFKKDGSTSFEDLKYTEPIYHINTVNKEHRGIYRCEASNNIDEDVHSMQLIVDYPPSITMTREFKFKQLDTVTLDCIVDGYPKPLVQWFFGKKKIEVSYEYQIFKNNSLSFKGHISDNGIYRCKAENIAGQEEKYTNVFIYEPPTVTISSESKINIEFNAPLSLRCDINAYPLLNVTWTDDSGSILSSEPMMLVDIPCYYKSVLHMEHVNKNVTVTCTAVSGAYMDSKSVYIETNNKSYMKILKYPNNTTVRYTKSYEFVCLVDSSPAAAISWFKDNEKIINDENYRISPENSTLLIKRMNPKVKGNYYVNISNNQETKIFPFNVSMSGTEIGDYTSPLITILPESPVNVEFGGSLTLKCKVRAYPKPNITWTDDSDTVSSSQTTTTLDFPYDYMSVVKVNEINKNMTFTCTAVNVEGDEDTKSIEVITKRRYMKILDNPKEPMSIEPPVMDTIKAIVDSTITLHCRVHGYPKPQVKWKMEFFDSKNLSLPLSFNKTTNSLKLDRIQINNQGKYTCTAENIDGIKTISYEVYVLAVPIILDTLKSRTLYGIAGDRTLRIPCKASGSPKPIITWQRNGIKIAKDTHLYDIEDDGTLIIKNLPWSAQGTYICTASNMLSYDSIEYNVKINSSVDTSKHTFVESILAGSSKEILCGNIFGVYSKPGDYVRWYKDELFYKEGQLFLSDAKKSDSGVYTCTISTPTYSKLYSKVIIVVSQP